MHEIVFTELRVGLTPKSTKLGGSMMSVDISNRAGNDAMAIAMLVLASLF